VYFVATTHVLELGCLRPVLAADDRIDQRADPIPAIQPWRASASAFLFCASSPGLGQKAAQRRARPSTSISSILISVSFDPSSFSSPSADRRKRLLHIPGQVPSLQPLLGRIMAPLPVQISASASAGIEPRQPREHIRVIPVMVGKVESLGSASHKMLALIERHLPDHHAVVLRPQARQELPERLVSGMPVGRRIFRLRKRPSPPHETVSAPLR
jgi:hypothetical protein